MEFMRKPELLSPAGDFERLKFAILYGADAVYLGATQFGMRVASKNFDLEELSKAVKFAHSFGKKVYLTLNTVPTNEEIAAMPAFIEQAYATGIDAVIVADIGVMSLVKKYAPDLEIHLSTQVGIMNYATANAAWEMGAKRVVLARELDLEQIAVIRQNTPKELELEAFIHGAMCMSFSGRCLLSHYLNGRDGNRGACSQPCRWEWQLTEKSRPGQYYDIGENESGSYILNADDMCTAPFLREIYDAGVDSFKIEGRAKSFYYVASVTAAYRKAMDLCLDTSKEFILPDDVFAELSKTSHRRYSPGFYFGRDGATQNATTGGYIREWDVIAVVEDWNDGIASCTQRGKFVLGETLEALTPQGEVIEFTPEYLWDNERNPIENTAKAMMEFCIPVKEELPQYSIIRKKRAE